MKTGSDLLRTLALNAADPDRDVGRRGVLVKCSMVPISREEAEELARIADAIEKIWCNSHNRIATHIDKDGKRCCDPSLGGILLPCSVGKITS